MTTHITTKGAASRKRGFTLVFAVLVSALILAVGISIVNIALKQVLFSGIGRESQFAYYAADAGVECALFWDFRGIEATSNGVEVFATSSQSNYNSVPAAETLCGAGSIVDVDDGAGGYTYEDAQALAYVGTDYGWDIEADSNSATTTFTMVLKQEDAYYCAEVRVSKWIDTGTSDPSDDRPRTTIDSRGYNTCDESADRRYERGLRARY